MLRVLQGQGEPVQVAARYRSRTRSLTLGGLRPIGRQILPSYLLLLRTNLAVTLVLSGLIAMRAFQVGLPPLELLASTGVAPALVQITLVALVFIAWDSWHTRHQHWWRPRAPALRPALRAATIVALVLWCLLTVWWAAVPYVPSLLFGPLADHLTSAPGLRRVYLPMLLVLLFHVMCRAIELTRRSGSLAIFLLRATGNALGLIMLFVLTRNALVQAAPGSQEQYVRMAQYLNAPALFLWFLPFIGINLAANLLAAVQLLRSGRRADRTATA